MKIRSILFAFLFVLPTTIFAGLTGTYKVSGINIHSHTKYKGKAVITRSGNVYTAVWDFGDGDIEIGTGVRKDDCISFVFAQAITGTNVFIQPTPAPGVILYAIKDDTLKGPWVIYNTKRRGYEKLKKINSKTPNFLPPPPIS